MVVYVKNCIYTNRGPDTRVQFRFSGYHTSIVRVEVTGLFAGRRERTGLFESGFDQLEYLKFVSERLFVHSIQAEVMSLGELGHTIADLGGRA